MINLPAGSLRPNDTILFRNVLVLALMLQLFGAAVTSAQITLVGQSNPAADQGEFFADVWGEGDYAYVGTWGPGGITEPANGVYVFDVSNTSQPNHVATYNGGPGGLPYQDVKVHDGIGYFGIDDGSENGTDIVDLTDPTNPLLLVRLTESGHNSLPDVHNISIAGGFLYQSDSSSGTVAVFDVSQPSSPFFVRDIDLPGGGAVHDITALGDRLYVNDISLSRTLMYDVSGVGNQPPALLGSLTGVPASHSSWASADGNLLINAEETFDGAITLWDINDPSDPQLHASIRAGDLGIDATSPHNPVLSGDILYVSWYEAGVQVLDVSEPANPVHLGFYDTFPGPVVGAFQGNWGVYPLLGHDRVLLSDLEGGLIIVDASSVIPLSADFNGDGNLDGLDIDSLVSEVAAITHQSTFDLTGDGLVTLEDRDAWLAAAGQENLTSGDPYLLADANLDGNVDGTDFIAWNIHKFTSVAAWTAGDFNADGVVDGGDFLIWNAFKFQSADADPLAVPEPTVLAIITCLAVLVPFKRKRSVVGNRSEIRS